MVKNIVKYRNIYLFIAFLSLIGFISGFFYYQVQPSNIKDTIKEKINIKEDLEYGYNNVFKSSKKAIIIFLSGFFIVTIFFNIGRIFYEPFLIGFIFRFLCSYNLKLAFIYCFLYHVIPFLFFIILIRISFTISKDILKLIINRNLKKHSHLKVIIQKYLIITRSEERRVGKECL